MPVPNPNKILTPLIVVASALLIAAAPPSATPDAGAAAEAAACQPPDEELAAAVREPAPRLDATQQALADHLSRRFYVAGTAIERMVVAAHQAAAEVGLDPLLVLAVIAIESRFNPIAESGMGAKGLMQIIPKYHLDKLHQAGGEEAVFDPESNIHVGARILQEYVHRTGTLVAGLQYYNGAWRDNSAQYAQKVMAERDRLEQMLRERNVPLTVAAISKGL
jgi:soluble lytic murein transglycosylase-like protein